jgi:putative phosphoribosyl transferase
MSRAASAAERIIHIDTGGVKLEGSLVLPPDASGIVLFAHGSGSSRHSTRNQFAARVLQNSGLGTLLIDLLTADEELLDRRTAHLRFDIPLLANRIVGVIDWIQKREDSQGLSIGLFGASTGAAAAIIAASERPVVKAVISRGGRPDLAGETLGRITAPVLLIVGSLDYPVIELNEQALAQINAQKELAIVPGASHLFEEPGTLEQAAGLAAEWLGRHLARKYTPVKRNASAGGDGQHSAPHVYRGAAERAALITEAAEPFDDLDSADLSSLLDRIGNARVVLIGEASHGTSEFYRLRARITQELIRQRGFTIVAAEADWPDAEHIDEYVRQRHGKPERAWQAFDRFPSWMWRNHEVLEFIEWLRAYNDAQHDPERKVGFYGLDLYSLYTSIHEVIRYLEDVDLDLAGLARRRYDCLTPFEADPSLYGSAVISQRYRECEDEAVAMLKDLIQERMRLSASDGERFFDAERNAALIASAEEYYRIMYYGSPESWNLRDRHMFETLKSILDFRGPSARAVVWAHNSHVGNAAATGMHAAGEINIGQLAREHFGDEAYLIGFGTHTGSVAAASNWGGRVEIKTVRPSHRQSYERLFHDSGVRNFMLPLRRSSHADLRHELGEPRLERAIGVIYRPDTELQSHYFTAVLPHQFDEYLWLNETKAVHPLERSTAPSLPKRHPFLLID